MTGGEYIPERRPLRAREAGWAKRAAALLADRGASPNAISVAGAISAVLGGLAFALTSQPGWTLAGFLLGTVLMTLRALANMLDGMVAVSTGRQSRVGELYNEVPDRVSDAALMIGAGYAWGGTPELGYLAAIASLFVAYVRAQDKAAGAHQEFCGPMAKTHRMAILTAAALASATARLVGGQPASDWRIVSIALGVIIAGCLVTAIRRLLRVSRTLRGGVT